MTDSLTPLPVAPVIDALDRGFDACGTDGDGRDLYALFLSRVQREHVPYTITWELTHICNLQCVMCYNVPRHQPELSTAECLDLLEQMAQAGTLRLTLTGGEILTRRINRRVPLRALYALEQRDDFSLQRLSPGEAVVALALTEKVAAERTSSAAAWLAVAEHLVQQAPVYRLGVSLRPGLWEFLAAAAGQDS